MALSRGYGVRLLAVSMALCGIGGTASAKDGGPPSNACPYDMAVTVDLGRTSLTIPQSALSESSAGMEVEGYELRADHSRLVLEIIGRRGDVWHAPMTKLVRGKRCQGVYLGRAIQAAQSE